MLKVMSDLHLEFMTRSYLPFSLSSQAEYLFCAGDIGDYSSKLFKLFFETASKEYKQVFYVTGNHEYYGHEYSIVNSKIDEMLPDNCHRLDKNRSYTIDLGDREYNVVGCTLWTDVSFSASLKMNDTRRIFDKTKKVTVDTIKKWNREDISWLREWFSTPSHTKTTIVMTHHLPSYELIHPSFADEGDNSGFANDGLDDVIAKAKLWLFGHTHRHIDKVINGTRCYVNPRGYPDEVSGYNRDGLVSL